MRKLLFLLSIFAIVLSCSSDETSTPVTPPPAPIAKYTITLSAGEGGTVSTTGGEYEAGQTVSVTATPQGEYLFKDWSDGNTNATRTITVSSNSTLTANFEKRKYPLTVNFDGEGEVIEEIVNSGRTTEYDSGTTVKLTAQAAAEWVFIGWTGDIESTEESVQIVIGEPKEVTATFEKKKYPLTVNIDGEGEVLEEIVNAGRTTDYDSGTTVKLTAVPAEGWRFKRWSNENYNSQIEILLNSNIELIAEFEELSEELISFYDENGGRENFHPYQVLALETLLFTQKDIENDNLSEAKKRIDFVFSIMPRSDNIWNQIQFQTESTNSHCTACPINIGGPVSYYGLRMLEQIISNDNPSIDKSLELTVVVASCAKVTRPTLPNLSPETVELNISEKILENNNYRLKISSKLFRQWIKSITGGYNVNLNIHIVDECVEVNYSDDGEIIRSYVVNPSKLIDKVPIELAEKTDFWWTVVPSGVPGDGTGFNRHFITGGMGGYKRYGDSRYNRPHMFSDDAWFIRKPEHMGLGNYHEIELKAYQPQYFQHEFMHYFYAIWSEFGLEKTSHQWFDRSKWPNDFEGVFEPDYYFESIQKRLINASPSLAYGLEFPGSPKTSLIDPYQYNLESYDSLIGFYEREPIQNDWHKVEIIETNGKLRWRNAAGVTWSLEIKEGELWTGPDCVYGEQKLGVYIENDGGILGLIFQNEVYERVSN